MNLNETEVNNYLKPFLGRYEDSFQETWVDILEYDPQALKSFPKTSLHEQFFASGN